MAEQTQEKGGFSYYFKTIYPLVVIAVFFGIALGVAWKYMGPIIEETQKKEETRALKSVVQAGETFTLMSNVTVSGKTTNIQTYYQATGSDGKIAGYVFKEGAVGYGGPVQTLIGITNGTVESIFILNADQETPGLGYKCMDKPWQQKWAGIKEGDVPAGKAGFDKVEAEAITGATLTSMAIANNIKAAYALYRIVAGGK